MGFSPSRRVDSSPPPTVTKMASGSAPSADEKENRHVQPKERANGVKKEAHKPKTEEAHDVDDDDDDEEGGEEDDDEEDEVEEKGKAKRKTPAKDDAKTQEAGDEEEKKTSKKSRRELPPHTVAILKGWMLSPEHVKHPYPTDEDKQMLLKKTGINMKQLTNWFTNARKRIWKPMMRREHSRQLQNAMEFEKRGGAREGFPVAPMPYREAPQYPPRAAVRHSFDAGSLGAPPPTLREHVQYHAYEAPAAHAYGMAPPPHPYAPRGGRSMSESTAGHEVDEYIDAMRIRKRALDVGPDGADAEGMNGAEKRYRRQMMSPRCLKILQDWVAAHSHLEYPVPSDTDKLQLSRDTGLDVQQIESWFKNNVGRFGALAQPPVASQPSTVPPQHPQYRSIPSRTNSMFPPPPAYGERRSIPGQGNPMFPPRPAAAPRSSIPGPGNAQFPPPPGGARENGEMYRASIPSAYGNSMYPPPQHAQFNPADPHRPIRSASVSASQYAQGGPAPTLPPPAIPAPVGAPNGLPALSAARPGPTMGQARDSRSHTLDMGQFADARRRKMNFQDILASTSAHPPAVPPPAHRPSIPSIETNSRPVNAENMYPEVMSSYAAHKVGYDRGTPVSGAQHPSGTEQQASGRIV
ncbi:hypothetical protein Poli38472_002402 [Pythium oligandrum]|uniref:Homeobox domain-containing protein n=1 Tax=Pythium oligandrum TaxID=41045 RepID=A0A8K1CIM8_PYTOL|nr:hypothetical protein Poli38472_002402 [Pythium oligandrum]|eukprot:TMW63461.1 hypothetical protein Poli38472_002402 [Pythium oligandrum]